MKERTSMEKFVVFPFSLGCGSDSSVAVANTSTHVLTKRQVGEESPSRLKIKQGLWGYLARQGVHSLKRSFKGFSQLFVYKEDIEVEMEMVIGYPTDVKHVTHIGLDGSTKIKPVAKGWENSKAPELLSLPSISIKQFELAMAAQATGSSRASLKWFKVATEHAYSFYGYYTLCGSSTMFCWSRRLEVEVFLCRR